VKDLASGKIEITSQNHSFAVEERSLSGTGLELSHVNLLDGTVEGIRCRKDRIMSVQYHPESAPGPQDSTHLFGLFTELMGKG
jgi:carbamoyl-phosphate synthase small subunit